MALTAKNRSRNFAVDLAVERDTAAVEGESGGIALEHEILNSDDFAAREQTAQLLVIRVGVGSVLRGERMDAGSENEEKDTKRRTNTEVHRASPKQNYAVRPI